MSDLTLALLEFQKAAPHLGKDGSNPHFGNRFPTLENVMETVRPRLNDKGLVLMQFPTVMENGAPALRTCIVHAESGDSVEDIMLLSAQKDGPQEQGSAITYARRYAILSILGLVADDDDDGEAASRVGRAAENLGTPTASSDTTAQPAPENPAEKAQKAQAAAKEARKPNDNGIPENVELTFGKHKGQMLGEVPGSYLEWLATKFEAKNAEQRRVQMAAQLILTPAPDPYPDIPF